jgi:glycosyltransferase involved in cell wall biosynthesis
MIVDQVSTRFVFADEATGTNGVIRVEEIRSLISPYSSIDVYSEQYSQLVELEESQYYSDNLLGEVFRYAQRVGTMNTTAYDIIHAHDWLTIPAALAVQQSTNKRFILHIHATEIDRTGGSVDQRIYDIERMGMHAADTIIAVSSHTKETIIRHYGIEPDKIRVVHNGIDYDSFKYAPVCNDTLGRLTQLKDQGYQLVLFVGRLTMQKGVEFLLEAAQKVIRHNPKTLFIIAGTGDLHHSLIYQAAQLRISKNIVFTGWVAGGQRTSLYSLADLFLMPSVSEPFGLVSLEAAVHNTPVILSKTSGAREILQSGIQVDYWDTDQTADLIYSVLEYQSLKSILSKTGQREAHNNTWDKTAHHIHQIYNHYQ